MVNTTERDRRIFDIFDTAPVTTRQLVKLNVFPSYQTANRRLIRLKKRKRGRTPRVIGTVAMHDSGREAKVYCSHRVSKIEHEVFLSEELIDWPIPFTMWKRGRNTDGFLRPDAEIDGLSIEFDRGYETQKQLRKQVVRYRDYDGFVVWCVPSVKQIDWIRKDASDNTLYKLHGASVLFDGQGRELSVAKLCDRILEIYQHPMGWPTSLGES
ncbi:hypothetical protein FHS27_004747 [Rhodopirellula rubra]|uniref:Uncharacterized protein n=1 Tax=Aporhodopirellula rubra TaxID=980271 RepID=A0A7W5H7Z1_9BACT|nr:hypothetical protein [Aporhodopirellula rubra]MBB3208913.1 hypothetical protein [Aporhodopirellula rubra]